MLNRWNFLKTGFYEGIKLRGTFIWIDEMKCGIVHIVTGTKWTGGLRESEEGELRWHPIEDLTTLEGLATHQRLFLDRILLDNEYFYSGIAVYEQDEMVKYADSLHPRRS